MAILGKKIRLLTVSSITLAVLFAVILPGDMAFAGVTLPEQATAVIPGPDNQPIAMQCSHSSGSLEVFGYTSNALHQYTIEKDGTSGFLDVGCPNGPNTVSGSLYAGEHIASSGEVVILSRNSTSSDPSRLRVYSDKGVFLREHLVKNECNATAVIEGFPVVNGNIVAFVYNSCQNYLNDRIQAIDIETGSVVFDKAIGKHNSFRNLSWYANGFVVYRVSDVALFTLSGAEYNVSATESRRVAVQPNGTVVYTSSHPTDSSKCMINFKDTDTTLVQQSSTCSQIQFFGRHTMPNGDILAIGKANGSVPGTPRIIHRDGSPDTELQVDIPDGVYNNSFYSTDMLVDANGKIVITSSYRERLTTTWWPFYEDKRRAVLDVFDSEGQHQKRWNSASLGESKTFAVNDNRDYRLTNGAIYAVNNDPYSYYPSNYGLEQIIIPDISMSYRDSLRWDTDGVDLAQFETRYLALGDSISSGEGDIEKNLATGEKYYRPFTDFDEVPSLNQPREKCHLSTRSYPYLLAGWMGLAQNESHKQWDSVACSGATTTDLYAFGYGFLYNGQPRGNAKLWSFDGSAPRLEGYSNKDTLQKIALNAMIPGRIEQIEFVKKYKPSVITFTAGANDIDFGGKLQECITDTGTCDWATTKKPILGQQIKNQYDRLVGLYQELYEASGDKAKIYVIGYPQMVSDADPASCGKNTLNFDAAERAMMVNATDYLNTIIEKAAKAAGVKYIDVSDSLNGGKLCESGQNYVNGVATMDILAPANELQESFHPNRYGQAMMVAEIKDQLANQSMLIYDNCPATNDIVCPATVSPIELAVPANLGGEISTASQNVAVSQGEIIKTSPTAIASSGSLFKPNTLVEAFLHSNPIELDEYTSDSSGNISGTFTIPSAAPVGYHTLMLSGVNSSDEPIEVTQIVLVTGTDSADLDDNSVLDINQPCGPFITPANEDDDLDGIDDACDAHISEEPELYRVRLGEATRTYNGNPENENYLYIERNTRASGITGISGDYDPDSDGWAIVGASQGTAYSPTTVPDTAPIANFEVIGTGSSAIPYLYIRAGDHGCVSFSPTSLAQVQSGQNRAIGPVSYNTDECRQEDPGYDVDGDGFADDDSESLYAVRQGNGFIGEDPTRIYLFRNFHSAEAQLGISDYTPTGTPAGDVEQPIQTLNLLASIDPAEDYMVFNKLVLLEDINGKPLPTILAKDELDQCIAFQPSDTLLIKQTTQDTRHLTKLTALPTGVGCE